MERYFSFEDWHVEQDFYKTADLIHVPYVAPFLKNTKGQDCFSKNIRLTAKALEEFTKSMTTCRGRWNR